MIVLLWTVLVARNYADVSNDCKQLILMWEVPAKERSTFTSACERVAYACMKIENEAVDACGAFGPRSEQINSMMKNVTKLNTTSAITRADAGLKTCDQTDLLREDQISRCTKLKEECSTKKEIFNLSTGKTLEITCNRFQADSYLWSAAARRQPSKCVTIGKERDAVLVALADQRRDCLNISSQADAYSGTSRVDRRDTTTEYGDHDAKRCGLAGCREEAGRYVKQAIVDQSDRSVSPASSATTTPQWAREPMVDENHPMDRPDGRACGINGCYLKNGLYYKITERPSPGHSNP